MRAWGWNEIDIIIVTGDSYIDSPYIGAAVIGRVLCAAGYRVGIIAQPDIRSRQDIVRMGEPLLFWGVTGGSIDSMVANYTALLKRRRSDDFTPGGQNDRRPDRATIAYTNLIKRHFKSQRPIVLGGIEASLRRIAHYDVWSNQVRRSILLDAKADVLVYGMAENTIVKLARKLAAARFSAANKPIDELCSGLQGVCFLSQSAPPDFIELEAFETICQDPSAFGRMFKRFYQHSAFQQASGLFQRHGQRILVHNPPAPPLDQQQLDQVHGLDYAYCAHPADVARGPIKALETIQFAITTHRGCYGECNFCAIAIHQGRTVVSRSQDSIIQEARRMARHPDFKGIIRDVGGPTANMYGFECSRKLTQGACTHKRCLFPQRCRHLPVDHGRQIQMLKKLRQLPGIKKVFVASGVRHDLILADKVNGEPYLKQLIEHHISGQLKLAPEHCCDEVLQLMGKTCAADLLRFKAIFDRLCRALGKNWYLTYYLMAAHPGCTSRHMQQLRQMANTQLHIQPRQAQIFTPTPSTFSTSMYHTQRHFADGRPLFVEKDARRKAAQKAIITPPGLKNPAKAVSNGSSDHRNPGHSGKRHSPAIHPRRRPRRATRQ